MMPAPLRNPVGKMRTVARLATTIWRDRHYLQLIRAHDAVDPERYRASSPTYLRLPDWICPIHYVAFGERHGVTPSTWFSPYGYLRANPDLSSTTRPLLHYLEEGRHTGRPSGSVDRDVVQSAASFPKVPRIESSSTTACVLHLYYTEAWDEIAARLPRDGDLYVSLVAGDPDHEAVANRIKKDFPGAAIYVIPNHGRDIFPFLHLINLGCLDRYRAVCKIHAKRSSHRSDGSEWRADLLAGLLPEGEGPEATILAGRSHLEVPDDFRYQGRRWWSRDIDRVRELARRVGAARFVSDQVWFPAGSMFWCSASVIERLKALELGPKDFEPEYGQLRGTTAHAIERLVGVINAALEAEGEVATGTP